MTGAEYFQHSGLSYQVYDQVYQVYTSNISGLSKH